MRFWSRVTRQPANRVKQTRNVNATANQELGQRRQFTDPRKGAPNYDGAEMGSQSWQSAHDPTDVSRGGKDTPEATKTTESKFYRISNLTEDRTYNANTANAAELSDVLGTLLRDIAEGRKIRVIIT